MKLALGTVQWGMKYGITNYSGVPGSSEIEEMLSCVKNNGIDFLDTAYSYGNAETIIGELSKVIKKFNIVTKIKPIENNITKKEIQDIGNSFTNSLSKLNVEKVYGLMVHKPENLLQNASEMLWDLMQEFKQQKKVNKIGASVFCPNQLEEIINKYDIDIVQFPYSIYDQRFLKNNLIQKLYNKKIEIHVRSVFLQGILLTHPNEMPDRFKNIYTHHQKYYKDLENNNITSLEACLQFADSNQYISKIVIGCENKKQLHQIITAMDNKNHISNMDFKKYSIENQEIINPLMWLK